MHLDYRKSGEPVYQAWLQWKCSTSAKTIDGTRSVSDFVAGWNAAMASIQPVTPKPVGLDSVAIPVMTVESIREIIA